MIAKNNEPTFKIFKHLAKLAHQLQLSRIRLTLTLILAKTTMPTPQPQQCTQSGKPVLLTPPSTRPTLQLGKLSSVKKLTQPPLTHSLTPQPLSFQVRPNTSEI